MTVAIDIRSQIIELEESFFTDGSPELYERVVDDDASFLIPSMGRLTKQQCVDAAKQAGAWSDHEVDDVTVIELAPDVVSVSYHVNAHRDETSPAYEAWMSSIWRHDAAGWRLVFNQHSPVD